MAALVVNSVTGATVTDGTRNFTLVAVAGTDGSGATQPAMDAATRPGFVRLCDGTNSVTLADSANVPVAPRASATGGATPYKYTAAASTNQDAQNVKSTAGTLYAVTFQAIAASLRYLKIYDKATAPTSADTPDFTIAVPASAGAVVSIPLPACGVAMANGIGIRITTGLADNDTGAATANDCVVNLVYQ